jgi:hypothetical protein
VAYDDWSRDFQDVYELSISGYEDYLSGPDREWAEYMFEEGFMHHRTDPGYDEASAAFAREQFFETLGMPDDYFDWEGWREAMGYNDLCLGYRLKLSRVIGYNPGCARQLVALRVLARHWKNAANMKRTTAYISTKCAGAGTAWT